MLKKALAAALFAAPLAANATDIVWTFDDTSLGGTDVVNDIYQLQISGGGSTVILTDTNGNGALDIGDGFVETGMVAAFGFSKKDGSPIADTNLNQTGGYELWAEFDPLVGVVSGATILSVGPATTTSFTATFTVPSAVSIFYDTAIDGNLTGGSTLIGSLDTPRIDSVCTTTRVDLGIGPTGVTETGSCVLTFEFDDAGTSGVWTYGGIDLADYEGVQMRVDMNVDDFSPAFFSPTYAVPGGTQVVDINHNGSASFVPEPSLLALMGAGLFAGVGAARRRKA